MKPTCGPAREDCRHGNTPADGGNYDVGVIGNGAECVNAATESAPARTEEVILGQPVAPGLLEIERTRGERCWNQWSPRHCPESWARRPSNGTQPINGKQWWEKRESTALKSRSAAHSVTAEIRRWSGRRASNPLPRPWQGRALPSELLPLGQREDHNPGRQADFTGRQCVNRRPHLSRSWFTLIADSCSLTRSRRPDSTAARTAARASAS